MEALDNDEIEIECGLNQEPSPIRAGDTL